MGEILFQNVSEANGIRTTVVVERVGVIDPPAPDPEPEPNMDEILTVQAARPNGQPINCHFIRGYNAAGRPIMEIYPKSTAPVSERVQIPDGMRFDVIDVNVKADGGGLFFEIYALPFDSPSATLFTPIDWVEVIG